MKQSVLFVCLIFAITCTNSNSENQQIIVSQVDLQKKQQITTKFVNSDLERSRVLWREKQITDYDFTIMSASQGGNVSYPHPALIKVRDNKFISVSVNSMSDNNLEKRYEKINTIDKLFDIIQLGFEKGAKVDVKYNEQFGYPENILIDDFKNGIDSWLIVKIRKFESAN